MSCLVLVRSGHGLPHICMISSRTLLARRVNINLHPTFLCNIMENCFRIYQQYVDAEECSIVTVSSMFYNSFCSVSMFFK